MESIIEAENSEAYLSAGDSGYHDTVCSTQTLRSSVYAYEQENGRTYHSFHAGKYDVPNDEAEQARMELHYHNLRLSMGNKLFHAPVASPLAVLDVGTGTGIWAMDVADEFPGAQVFGFDLSPIQPTLVPPNLRFEIMDADEDWDYGHHSFDLVHTRFMNGYSLKSWPHFYQEAFKYLRPGGWVENQEFDCQVLSDDNTIPEDSKVKEWVRLWNEGMGMIGKTGRCDPEVLAQQMRDAGLINVHILRFKLPIGPWPKQRDLKEAGIYGLAAMLEGMQGLSLRTFTRYLGWSVEQLELYLVDVRKELRRKSIHSYWPAFCILGQKPPDTSRHLDA
jgi:SAM-dependent methyltransferase